MHNVTNSLIQNVRNPEPPKVLPVVSVHRQDLNLITWTLLELAVYRHSINIVCSRSCESCNSTGGVIANTILPKIFDLTSD